jgi:hypothetical protein
MTEPRKSPSEKKSLDYKKQRRTTWDSDKAARKAIPAAKARRHREERTFAKDALRTAAKSGDKMFEDVSVAALRANTPLDEQRCYGHGKTLEEHVGSQLERRKNSPAKKIEKPPEYGPYSENFYKRTYVRDRDYHPFVDAMRLWLRNSQKPTAGSIKFAKQIHSYIKRDYPFFEGFFTDNPTWKARLRRWTDRVLTSDRT